MSILDSQIAPYLTILTIFAILLGFFRKMLVKVVIVLLVQVALFALFPSLLQTFVNLILSARHSL